LRRLLRNPQEPSPENLGTVPGLSFSPHITLCSFLHWAGGTPTICLKVSAKKLLAPNPSRSEIS
ncbi:MAG: hypothetical protein UH229_09390, partial [Lachnospiraceae bacterium]|nr:hypothetical protein [Lachnospiraceae bacterium]